MRWFKVVGSGIALWGLGLIWLEFKLVLLSPIVLAIAIIAAIAVSAYRLSCSIGQHQQSLSGEITYPATLPRPVPVLARHHHAHPTRPMPVSYSRQYHSNPTRPMPAIQ